MSEQMRAGDGWDGQIAGMCPVEGEGCVDGHAWYFRARGGHWSIGIANEPGTGESFDDAAMFAESGSGWFAQEAYGTWPEAGYMPLDVAWGFIEASIAKWRAMRAPQKLRDLLLRARATAADQIAAIDLALAAMVEPGDPLLSRKTTEAIRCVMGMGERDFSPSEVWATLSDAGRDIDATAVHQAMHRMAKRGEIVGRGRGRYALPCKGAND